MPSEGICTLYNRIDGMYAYADVFETEGEYTVTISIGEDDAKTELGPFGV